MSPKGTQRLTTEPGISPLAPCPYLASGREGPFPLVPSDSGLREASGMAGEVQGLTLGDGRGRRVDPDRG